MVVELRVDEGEEDLTMSAPSHIIISLFFFLPCLIKCVFIIVMLKLHAILCIKGVKNNCKAEKVRCYG